MDMDRLFSLDGKVALVTGGASSLGGSAAGVSSHATAGPLPLGAPLRFSLSFSLIRRRRRPGSAAC